MAQIPVRLSTRRRPASIFEWSYFCSGLSCILHV